jgi:hypothetical protein
LGLETTTITRSSKMVSRESRRRFGQLGVTGRKSLMIDSWAFETGDIDRESILWRHWAWLTGGLVFLMLAFAGTLLYRALTDWLTGACCIRFIRIRDIIAIYA